MRISQKAIYQSLYSKAAAHSNASWCGTYAPAAHYAPDYCQRNRRDALDLADAPGHSLILRTALFALPTRPQIALTLRQ